MIRAFIGIPVTGPLAGTLAIGQVGLGLGRLVEPENFHVTLAFLGELREPVVEDVADALSAVSGRAFTLRVAGLGTFGRGNPRILFAEVRPDPALLALRKSVRRAARGGGVELAHERYHPHVTLARFGSGLVGEDTILLQEHLARRLGRVEGEMPVTGFTLFESHLGRNGPLYLPLVEYPLA